MKNNTEEWHKKEIARLDKMLAEEKELKKRLAKLMVEVANSERP